MQPRPSPTARTQQAGDVLENVLGRNLGRFALRLKAELAKVQHSGDNLVQALHERIVKANLLHGLYCLPIARLVVQPLAGSGVLRFRGGEVVARASEVRQRKEAVTSGWHLVQHGPA